MEKAKEKGLHRRSLVAIAMICHCLAAQATRDVRENFQDGSPYRIYHVNVDDERTGLFTEYNRAGKQVLVARYKAGKLSGTYKSFHQNGKRKLVASYRDGMLVGRYTGFGERGQKILLMQYRNGVRHGKYERWFPSGERRIVARFHEGKRDGKHAEYFVDGTPHVLSVYLAGERHGLHQLFEPSEKLVQESHYVQGILEGEFKRTVDGKLNLLRTYSKGVITGVDGITLHPVPKSALVGEIRRLLALPHEDDKTDKANALHHLQAYRYLCRVPYQGMELNKRFNELCQAATAIFKANGKTSHDPEKPADFDDELFRKGCEGASHSNLATDHRGLAGSIHSYMDDSDETNIDHVGHRRWCLNPKMRKTGFGITGDFAAMWAFDASGRGVTEAICYPPRGFVPTNFFGPFHAWSVMFPRVKALDVKRVEVRMWTLDSDYRKEGKPLDMNHLSVQPGGNLPACVIFRPSALRCRAGMRYWVEVSLNSGKSIAAKYAVEFIRDVRPPVAKK